MEKVQLLRATHAALAAGTPPAPDPLLGHVQAQALMQRALAGAFGNGNGEVRECLLLAGPLAAVQAMQRVHCTLAIVSPYSNFLQYSAIVSLLLVAAS